MGSDLAMNPPREVFDRHTCTTEEEVIDWVIGALATKKKIVVHSPNIDGTISVQISTGKWI